MLVKTDCIIAVAFSQCVDRSDGGATLSQARDHGYAILEYDPGQLSFADFIGQLIIIAIGGCQSADQVGIPQPGRERIDQFGKLAVAWVTVDHPKLQTGLLPGGYIVW